MNRIRALTKTAVGTGIVAVFFTATGCGITAFDVLSQLAFAQMLFGGAGASAASTPPSGYFEVKSPTNASAHWENADAPLVQIIDSADLMQDGLILEDDTRLFLQFGDAGQVLETLDYVAADNALYVEQVGTNPLIGAVPARGENAWVYTAVFHQSTENASVDIALTLSILDGDPSQDRVMTAQMRVTITLTEDIADPNTGTIHYFTGESAVWIAEETYAFSPSMSPMEQFTGATLLPKPADDDEN